MSQETRSIRVAIVGAGIAGLTLAVALNVFDKQKKIVIDIYESVPELCEIGAGINVWPRTWRILREIGLGDALIPLFDHYPNLEPRIVFEIRKADQRNGFKVMDVITEGGVLRIHRADFQRTLINHIPLPGSTIPKNSTCTLHLSHRLVDYTASSSQSGPITLHFAEGKPSKTCDILVGADGIKSTVRQLFLARLQNPEKYRPFLYPVWSGTTAYRGLVEKEELEKVFPGHRALSLPGVMYIGKGKHTVVYPISGGKYVNVVATEHDKSKEGTFWEGPWNIDTTQEEIFDRFAGWEDEYQALLQCIHHPTKWALYNLNHLDVYARGRVILLGDSAHAMVPHQGAGAGVGIEDAFVLATLLAHPSHSTTTSTAQDHRHTHLLSRISEIYNTIRVPRGISSSKASINQGHLYTLEAPGFERFKAGEGHIPRDILVENFCQVQRNYSWHTADPMGDRDKAIELLLSSVVEGKARL